MADQESVVDTGVSDSDMFAAATAPERPAPAGDTGVGAEPAPPAPPPQGGVQRDEHGRFASKTTTQDEPQPPLQDGATPDGTKAPDGDGHVPSWRLREEREAREAAARRADNAERAAMEARVRLEQYERRLAQQQQDTQREPIDPIADPQAFIAMMREERERERMEDRLQFSMERAHEKHGETFEQAYNAFVNLAPGNQLWAQSVLKRPNPGAEIVNWYNKERIAKEIGDPTTYRAKIAEELLDDADHQAKVFERAKARANGQVQGSRPNNITQMPVSLSRVPGGGPSPSLDNDASSAALYSHATRR